MRIPSTIYAALALVCFFTLESKATASLSYAFTSSTNVAVTGTSYNATGTLSISLRFAPTPGSNLTVVENTGLSFISGTFTGVPQGTIVPLTYNGTTYNFIANYYAGNGRSFVLQWPCIGLAAWGWNIGGLLGNNNTANSSVPVSVTTSGVLAGKTAVAMAGGIDHSIALTADGKVYAWGLNTNGELGDGTTTTSGVPVAVNTSGELAGKTVIAIAAGAKSFNLALSTDGKVFSWGFNLSGQLGNSGSATSLVPIPVDTTGVLSGKVVVAIAAGMAHCLALTSDGEVFAWGYNYDGELGNNSSTNSALPVPVITSGALSGKTVVAIAAGYNHSLALTSDGNVYAWGDNTYGELGNNTTTSSKVPVAVNTSGVLAGATVVAITAGGGHSMALTADGKAFTWGRNNYGQLGNNSVTNSKVPVAVITSGVLASKKIVGLAAGNSHSLAVASDGNVYAWGFNNKGQLGNQGTTNSSVPVAVDTSGVLSGEMAVTVAAGDSHSLTLFGSGPPTISVNPSGQTAIPGASATFAARASDNPALTIQWQVSVTGTSGTFSNIDSIANPTAKTGTLGLTNVAPAQNGYAYRAVFTNSAGTSKTTAALLRVYSQPTVYTPGSVTANAVDKNGAAVWFNPTATDSIDGSLTPVCTPPSGSVFPIGTTTVICSATNSGGLSATTSFPVTVLRSYAAYQDQYGLPSTDPTADPSGTGICNLAAYAFGVNPSAPDRSQLPSASVQDGFLQIIYPAWINAGDLTYVEVSGDLIKWSSGDGSTIQVSTTPDPDDGTRQWVTVRDLMPVISTPRRFIRVRLVY